MGWTAGQRLNNGKYTLQQDLGNAGFGLTYLAQDASEQPVVIKALNEAWQADPNFETVQQNFLNEALQIAKCQHRHLVTIYEAFQERIPHPNNSALSLSLWCIAMEYVAGQPLEDRVKTQGVLSEAEALLYIQQIGEALTVVHDQGILHRDVTPQNIMLRSGEKETVLIGFGMARDLHPNRDQRHTSLASEGFAPIEHYDYRTNRGPYTDIYALAATLYYGLTHTIPLDARTRELNRYKYGQDDLRSPKDIVPSLSDQVNQAIMQGLAIQPVHRPQTITDWFYLLGLLSQPSAPSAPTPTLTSAPPTSPSPPNPNASPNSTQIPSLAAPPGANNQKDSLWQQIQQWFKGSDKGSDSSTPPPAIAPSPRQYATPQSTPPSPSQPSLQKPLNLIKLPDMVLVNDQGQVTKTIPVEVNVYDENLGSGLSLRMVEIPAGTFTMGSPQHSSEQPQRQVTVPQFFMGMFAITQAQYQVLMGNNPSRFVGNNRPVETVSWNDADAFCKKLSQRTGTLYRLPSEAEWEYACRAGTITPFHFGETITPDLANFDGNYAYAKAPKGSYPKETLTVGCFPPNGFGLFDMHGNVWEWCADHWHDNYNGAPNDAGIWLSSNTTNRVLRGGSWFNRPRYCRSALRNQHSPNSRNGIRGFRVMSVSL